MSDEDDFLSEESYEFEFEEDEDEEVQEDNNEEDYKIENKYYNAKALKDDDPEAAIKEFESITQYSQDDNSIEWIFKSYKQIIKINFYSQQYEESIKYLKRLIEIIPKVNQSYAEESMSKILNNYSTSSDTSFVTQLYDIILNFLSESKNTGGNNDRLWMKININKLNIFLENKEFDKCPELIKAINDKLEKVSEMTRNSYSLEVIAAEIEYYSHMKDIKLSTLNQLYRKSLTISTAVTHPRIMGIIRECGAKIQFYRGNYEKARLEFYECFKNYDEAGSSLKKKILKYLTLCSILTENEVNPFESQETQTYSQLPEYANLMLLIKFYDELDLNGFNKIIKKINIENDPLSDDEIFKHASNEILKNLRSKIIIQYLKSFKTIKFSYIANKLSIDQNTLEYIILKLVTQGKLSNIKLDFVNQYIETNDAKPRTLPTAFDSKEVYYNLKSLDAINFNSTASNGFQYSDDNMDIDYDRPRTATSIFDQDISLSTLRSTGSKESNDSILTKFLFLTEKPSKDSEWFNQIHSWLQYLSSAIPARFKHELSQKDQIFSEQRAENIQSTTNLNTLNNVDNDHTRRNSIMGNLGSNIASRPPDDVHYGDNNEIDKIDALKNWCSELKTYKDNLVAAHYN